MSVRVLLCDDQAVWRAGLRAILEDEPDIDVVGEAADGLQAVRLARELAPDLVLMDVRMPELDGIQATAQLAGPSVADPVRVVILTILDHDEYVLEALRAGAIGYLLKDLPCRELVDAVRITAAGGTVIAPTVTRRLLDRFARRPPASPGTDRAGLLDRLTRRELEVLRLLAQGQLNAEMAAALSLSETTVKSHVSHVLGKLGLHDRAQAVVLAYETGLVRAGDDDPPIRRRARAGARPGEGAGEGAGGGGTGASAATTDSPAGPGSGRAVPAPVNSP